MNDLNKLKNTIENLKTEIKQLKKYKKGYEILSCYFDSISDEEQPKVAKQLEKLGI